MMQLKTLVNVANKSFDGDETELYFELPNGKVVELCNITKGENGELILRGEVFLK